MTNEPLLNVEEVRPLFKVSKSTFYDWINNNMLPADLFIKIGRTIKFKRAALDKYFS